jgi:hypothetical protein
MASTNAVAGDCVAVSVDEPQTNAAWPEVDAVAADGVATGLATGDAAGDMLGLVTTTTLDPPVG